MKQICILILTSLVFLTAQSAHADVIPNSCISGGSEPAGLELSWAQVDPVLYSEVYGIRCENIRAIAKGAAIAAIGITTIQVALKNPAISSAVTAQLAALGLAAAGPTVASVTILGTLGIGTVTFFLTNSIEECARMDALEQDRLIRSLEAEIGALRTQQTKIHVQQ
jgi:hypothetical protein